MKDNAYILQLDAKALFPNWDKMTKEERQKWKNKLEAFKGKSRPVTRNHDRAEELHKT